MGEIVDTVETLLAGSRLAMHIAEIHQAVEQELEREISTATIKDLLYKHARTGRIVKVRRGMYASPSSELYRSPPILQTIVDVLRTTDRPMRLKEIHAECEVTLGGPVSYLAVKSSVSRHAGTSLIKVRYGWYVASHVRSGAG